MAIIVSQGPAEYNLVVSPNVYTLSGIGPTDDGYALQVDAWDEDTVTSTEIATILQPANPAGVAHFDISKILQSYMDIKFVEDTAKATDTDGTSFSYRVRYGRVVNDVPLFEPGYDTVRYVLNGYEDWRSMNWPTQTAFIPDPGNIACETGGTSQAARYQEQYNYLHNYPKTSIPIRSASYRTLSFFNRIRDWNQGVDWGVNIQPYAVRIKFFTVTGTLIQTAIYALSDTTGLGPRTTFDATSVGSYTNDELIGTIGAGPQNLIDAGYWPNGSSAIWNQVIQTWGNYAVIWNLAQASAIVDSYQIDVMSIDQCKVNAEGMPTSNDAATLEPYLDAVIYSETFQIENPCTGYEPVNVSFLNQYGVKDYFSFDRRNTYNQSVKRNNYDKVLGSWSDATFAVDPHGRGRKTFSTEIETNMELNSYWMSDEESAWLEELFTSPHIQVYYNGIWTPAVITSNSYEQKTNVRNGLFQHTLNIRFANTKRVQRG